MPPRQAVGQQEFSEECKGIAGNLAVAWKPSTRPLWLHSAPQRSSVQPTSREGKQCSSAAQLLQHTRYHIWLAQAVGPGVVVASG